MISVKSIAVTAVVSVLLVLAASWLLAGSAEDLLDKEQLTPKEIRRVAKQLLLHPDLEIRSRASRKLAEQGETAVPVLREVSRSTSNVKLRLAVFAVLGPMDPEVAVEVLEDIMADPDPEVRLRAMTAAAQLSTPGAVTLLTRALDDPDTGIRSSAAGLLGRTGSSTAVPALQKALEDQDRAVRKHAARSLHDLTGQDYSGMIDR